MSKIKLITLDLDNTLWDVDAIIIKAEQDLLAWLHQQVPDSVPIYTSEQLLEIRTQVFSEHAKAAHDLSFMRIQVLTEVMRRTGMSEQDAQSYAEQAFAVFFAGRNRVELFEGAEDMLADLSARYPIYALTNGNANIDRTGLGHYFKGAFSSADVGNKKPHPDMFHAPLNLLSLAPEQAVHIGDHLIDDIEGAAGIGMHSIWVNFPGAQRHDSDAVPTREVDHLAVVSNAVDEISSN